MLYHNIYKNIGDGSFNKDIIYINSTFIGHKDKDQFRIGFNYAYSMENSKGFWRHAIFIYLRRMRNYRNT